MRDQFKMYLPKCGPMKAGWRNMAAVPRKVPRPRGEARGGAEPLWCCGARPGKAAAAAAAAVQADSRAGWG